MGGSARYRFGKKLDKLQQKYGEGYSSNPDYQRELQEARQKYAEQRMGEIERAAARKQGDRQNTGPYSENYSQERMDQAIYANHDQKLMIDDLLRGDTEKWWAKISEDEQIAAYDYTGDYYDYINKMLGGAVNPIDIDDANVDRINYLTDALEKSEITEDMWVRRGVSNSHIARLVGFNREDAKHVSPEQVITELTKAINNGKIMDIANFMSTSAVQKSGFTDTFEMKIFVPKGSKGVYAEPFSAHGILSGSGTLWDGKEEQSQFGDEFEIILQRGYKLKPIAFNRNEGKAGKGQIVFMIVGKDTKPYVKPEVDWNNI
ncbi:MAG: hypothetical protein IJI57_04755 [Flexilinea sp.]|nr:hypothetical protein [Flexilinea sp.]